MPINKIKYAVIKLVWKRVTNRNERIKLIEDIEKLFIKIKRAITGNGN